jgi:hypothetical protein
VGIIDSLNNAWTGLLDFLTKLIVPDWGSLIGLLPLFLLIGVLGPLLSILLLGQLIYVIRRPRTGLRYAEGPRQAALDADGRPVFPPGYPHCLADGLIFPSGTARCPEDGSELWVVCPMCGLGRAAAITTCGNCGLVLSIVNRPTVLEPAAGPPPGGAAAA